MSKVKVADVVIRHRKTGLYLHVENLGRPQAENDVYGSADDATCFGSRGEAIKVAKRLGLLQKDVEIEPKSD